MEDLPRQRQGRLCSGHGPKGPPRSGLYRLLPALASAWAGTRRAQQGSWRPLHGGLEGHDRPPRVRPALVTPRPSCTRDVWLQPGSIPLQKLARRVRTPDRCPHGGSRGGKAQEEREGRTTLCRVGRPGASRRLRRPRGLSQRRGEEEEREMGVRCSLPALSGPSPQTAPTRGSRSRRFIQAASSAQRRDLRPGV